MANQRCDTDLEAVEMLIRFSPVNWSALNTTFAGEAHLITGKTLAFSVRNCLHITCGKSDKNVKYLDLYKWVTT